MRVNPTSSITNKRFALVGLPETEEREIATALSEVGAKTGRIFASRGLPGLNPLAPYDVSILNGSAITPEGGVAGIAIAAFEKRQALVIVDESQLGRPELVSTRLEREFMVRPIRIPELLARLSELVRKGEGKYFVPRSDAPCRRALIVDDDWTARILLEGILETAGFDCDCVGSAGEALTALSQHLHDLVLLDVRMPGMDGFKVLQSLRKCNPSDNLSIVMVTSAAGEEDLVRGFSLGADDYITKPFNSRELIARIERTIRSREPVSTGI